MLVHVWYAVKDLLIELLYMCITTICLFIYFINKHTYKGEGKEF